MRGENVVYITAGHWPQPLEEMPRKGIESERGQPAQEGLIIEKVKCFTDHHTISIAWQRVKSKQDANGKSIREYCTWISYTVCNTMTSIRYRRYEIAQMISDNALHYASVEDAGPSGCASLLHRLF